VHKGLNDMSKLEAVCKVPPTLTMPCILRGAGSGPSGFNCCQQHLQEHSAAQKQPRHDT
jgi:hypothetical protein